MKGPQKRYRGGPGNLPQVRVHKGLCRIRANAMYLTLSSSSAAGVRTCAPRKCQPIVGAQGMVVASFQLCRPRARITKNRCHNTSIEDAFYSAPARACSTGAGAGSAEQRCPPHKGAITTTAPATALPSSTS